MVAGGGVQDVLVGLLTSFAPSILDWIAGWPWGEFCDLAVVYYCVRP